MAIIFIKTVLSYWWLWLSGSVILFLVGLLERHFLKALTLKQYGAFLLVGIFVSCFQAWRDEHAQNAPLLASVRQLNGEKAKLVAEKDEFIRVLISKERPIEINSVVGGKPKEDLLLEAIGTKIDQGAHNPPYYRTSIELTNMSRGFEKFRVRKVLLLCGSEEIGFYDTKMYEYGEITLDLGANRLERDFRFTNSKDVERGIDWAGCSQGAFVEVVSTLGNKFRSPLRRK